MIVVSYRFFLTNAHKKAHCSFLAPMGAASLIAGVRQARYSGERDFVSIKA